MKAVFHITLPMMLISFIQPLIIFIDNIFLATIGDTQLAAVGIVTPVINLINAFSVGLGSAGIALIGNYIGRDDREKSQFLSRQLISLSLLISVMGAIIVFIFGQFAIAGIKGQLLDNTRIYLYITAVGIPLVFLNSSYVSIKRANGASLAPLIIMIMALVFKSVFNYITINLLGLEIAGAAYATIATNLVIVIIDYYDLFRKKYCGEISLKNFKLDKIAMINMSKIGLPSALSSASNHFSFILMNGQALSYGEEVLTAYGIANTLNSMFFNPITAVGGAMATIVSQNVGAGKIDRAKEAYRKTTKISFAISILLAIILVPLSGVMVRIFTDTEIVVYHATNAMRIYSVAIIGWSVFQAQQGVFIGTGKTKITLYSTIIRIWVLRIPFVYICDIVAPNMNEYTIWYSMLVSNIGILVYTCYKIKKIKWEFYVDI